MPQFAIPSATGLMVFARRENLITALLSGLSNQDEGIQEEAVKHVLLVYGQTKGMTPKISGVQFVWIHQM